MEYQTAIKINGVLFASANDVFVHNVDADAGTIYRVINIEGDKVSMKIEQNIQIELGKKKKLPPAPDKNNIYDQE
jgi:hypothetical protein